MGSPLLSLPYELREMIWELALCTHDAVIVDCMFLRKSSLMYSKEQRKRYKEPVEPMYPPHEDPPDEVDGGEGASPADDAWIDVSDGASMASDEREEAMQRLRPDMDLPPTA